MGSLIPNMWFRMTPYHPVTWHRACALPILPLKRPIHIAFSHNSATDQDRTIKFGSKYTQMDFYTNLTFKVQKGRGLGRVTQFRNFRTPLITFERIELSASNLVQTSTMHSSGVRTTKQVDVVWVTWPNFEILGPPLITLERIETSASNLAQT